MKKQIIFIFGLFLLALVACKKDALTLTEDNVKEQHVGNGGFRTFVNPFDSAGYWHNYWLDSFYNCTYVGDTGFNAVLVETFFENRGIDTMIEAGFPFVDISENNFDIEAFLINESELSERAIRYIMLTLATTENLETTLSDIAGLEETVEEDAEVPDPEKNVIFLALAIAKYSYIYWEENLDDWTGQDIFYSVGEDVVKGDVAGAVYGALATGFSGGTDFGGAIVTGAAVGSVGAAIISGGSWVLDQVGNNTGWW